MARTILFFINLHAAQGDFETTVHGQDWYFEVGKNIAAGHGFSIDGHSPSPVQVPLYPLFLAASLALFGSYKFAAAVQVILGSLIPVLGRRLSLKLIPSEKIGLWVGLALALEPNLVLLSSVFFSETLFILVFLWFTLSFVVYLEKSNLKSLALSSFLLGVSTLIRTVTQFLPVLLIPLSWWLLRRRLPPKALAFHAALSILIFLAVLSPWLYRNYKVFGYPGMTIMPSLNLYATFVPSVLVVENGTSFAAEQKAFINDRGVDLSRLTFANARDYDRDALNTLNKYPKAVAEVVAVNVFTFFTHDGMLTVLQNAGLTPGTYLPKSALAFFLSSPVEFSKTVFKYLSTPFASVFIMRLFWILVAAFFLAGSVILARRGKITAPITFALAVVLYFAVTTASNGLTVNARFRTPVNAIILSLAAYPFLSRGDRAADS